MDRIAHYNILEKIGSGGMGEVYRARDTKLGRTVAIKVLPPSVAGDRERRERLLREARTVAAISHPNIATLFQAGEEGETLFLVCEFVPGQTLHAAIGGRPMNTRRALDLAIQIADAVSDAHAAGIVHRDLKPDNIIVTPKGNAKILDFGLATWTHGGAARRQAASSADTAPGRLDEARRAESGVVLSTLAYMSPEQASGGPVDERSDIFSLGIVIFEMLTGRNPFVRTGGGLNAVTSILRDRAPAASSVNRDLPKELDPILAKTLEKHPDDRYPTAVTLAAELRSLAAILDVRSGASEPSAVVVPVAPRRGVRWGGIAILLMIGALATGAWLSRDQLWRAWRRYAQPPPDPIIAVLPLEVAEAGATYFADGLADDLITRLGQTPGIKVLGRSAMRAYRGSSPATIAGELGARVVLTGSVRRDGDELRVTVELVDPKDGVQVWSQQFDRSVRNVFAVQSDIAEAVARALRVTLAPSATRARTASRLVDARAYDLYVKAKDASARRDRRRAAALYEQAVAADPGLAEAHAGLAVALYLEAIGGGNPYDPTLLARVRRAATEATSIDPDLPEAQVAMGLAAERFSDALAHMRRAIDIDPTYAEGFHQLADQILSIDPARAMTFYRRTLELDARMDVVNRVDLGVAYVLLGQPERAEEEIGKALTGNPTGLDARLVQGIVGLARGRADAMVRASTQAASTRASADAPAAALAIARILQGAGRSDEAFELMRAVVDRAPGFCEGRAVLAGWLMDRGERIEARRMVDEIFTEADAPEAAAPLARCAATAAAALGDPVLTAGWLTRIAGREEALRWWGLEIAGTTGDVLARFQLYPWNKVAGTEPMKAAFAEIEKAYARLRAVAAEQLKGLP